MNEAGKALPRHLTLTMEHPGNSSSSVLLLRRRGERHPWPPHFSRTTNCRRQFRARPSLSVIGRKWAVRLLSRLCSRGLDRPRLSQQRLHSFRTLQRELFAFRPLLERSSTTAFRRVFTPSDRYPVDDALHGVQIIPQLGDRSPNSLTLNKSEPRARKPTENGKTDPRNGTDEGR
jgi:hypothetical protein